MTIKSDKIRKEWKAIKSFPTTAWKITADDPKKVSMNLNRW